MHGYLTSIQLMLPYSSLRSVLSIRYVHLFVYSFPAPRAICYALCTVFRSNFLFSRGLIPSCLMSDVACAKLILVPQYLEEDPRTNRIDDSLQLFTQICSNPLLKNVHLVLFLSTYPVQPLNVPCSVRP